MSEKQVAVFLGGRRVLGKEVQSRISMAELLERGLPERSLEHVKEELALTDAELSDLLGLSAKTISRIRQRPTELLDLTASDRLYRMARLFAFATQVLEDRDAAREWLRTPQIGLGRRVPLSLLTTEPGAHEVEALLGRIEHGVIA